MTNAKILLTYKDEQGNYQVESVWYLIVRHKNNGGKIFSKKIRYEAIGFYCTNFYLLF
jgi:hypothetical protein